MSEVTKQGNVRFEMGQLILAPFKGRDVLWAVVGVRKNGKATLLANFTEYTIKITTTVATLPDDWSLVTNGEAVYALTGVTNEAPVA